ncbi:MAG TPA: phage tail sheath C-terminal domain-containing protein [Blastocatellia bacterium]|nr:phage tail sheath C-terminal domain-containing protein [Blastocatellia bacterium]
MPEYLAPGVYVEEVSTGTRPIEGVSTSTAGMVGQTERGPTVPRLVTSWEDYYRWFGGYVDFNLPPGQAVHQFLPYAVRGFFDNGGQRLFVARITPPGAIPASGDIGNATIATAIGPGTWGNNIFVSIRPASLQGAAGSPTADWFRLTLIYYRDPNDVPDPDPTSAANIGNPNLNEPDVLEDFDNLSLVSTDTNFAQTVVNSSSRLITLNMDNTGGRPPDVPFGPNAIRLAGGAPANGEPTEVEYQGAPANPAQPLLGMTGLLGLSAIRDISLLAVPDEVSLDDQGVAALRSSILIQCETLKDRFAIMSATNAVQDGPIANIRPPQDSTYGAFYLPWVRVSARHTAEGHLLVPPTGHIAGIYARVDVERGVHKAPANEVVRGIITTDLSGEKRPLKHLLGKREQDLLNPRGVNVICDFRPDGRGIRVWGARTMSSDPMWKYINVRRLFIFVEQSIDSGTQWSVFEPNYESTWAAIRLSITAFLRTVWRNGALAGVTQDEAFFVKCDRTTMTQDDWDNGRLICLIGIAPVKPAEFVIFRISQKTVEAVQ